MERWQQLLDRLKALGAIAEDRLEPLASLIASGAGEDAVRTSATDLFDWLDAHCDDEGVRMAGMSLLASAIRPAEPTPPKRQAAPARPTLRQMNATRPRTAVPSRPPGSPWGRSGVSMRAAVTAGGALVDGGDESAEVIADAFSRAVTKASRYPGQPVEVLRAAWDYPEERRLGPDAFDNSAKIDAVCSPSALTASGGICGPVNVDYAVPSLSTSERPLRDDLPSFGASRGGIRYLSTPTLASVGTSAITVWPESLDANPGTATKSRYTVQCGTEQEVFVDAVAERILIGNMMGRYSPEYTDSVVQTVQAAGARIAEQSLLSKISAHSTAVSSGQLLGAARDLVATLDMSLAYYRDRHRLPDSTTIRLLYPRWVKRLVAADIARSLHAGDWSDALAVSDAEVEALFTKRGCAVTWMLESASASASGVTFPPQTLAAAQPANAALLDWPHVLTWWMFSEGSVQLLDGGSLSVQVVRDTNLNNTNDFEAFSEVFESIAWRGVEALMVSSSVRPNGLSAGSKDTSTY